MTRGQSWCTLTGRRTQGAFEGLASRSKVAFFCNPPRTLHQQLFLAFSIHLTPEARVPWDPRKAAPTHAKMQVGLVLARIHFMNDIAWRAFFPTTLESNAMERP